MAFRYSGHALLRVECSEYPPDFTLLVQVMHFGLPWVHVLYLWPSLPHLNQDCCMFLAVASDAGHLADMWPSPMHF